jgi:hypothetical protein
MSGTGKIPDPARKGAPAGAGASPASYWGQIGLLTKPSVAFDGEIAASADPAAGFDSGDTMLV